MGKTRKSNNTSGANNYYNEVKKGMYNNAIKDKLKEIALRPKQQEFYEKVLENDVIFCTGPSGTGKTYLSLYIALSLICDEVDHPEIKKLSLSKPIQEAGENLGFLPGDLHEKIHYHMESFKGNLNKLLDPLLVGLMEQDKTIDFKPLAYQRGINQDNCVMLLDEAQNASFEQLMLFITRMGEGSKCLIFGDVMQSDVSKHQYSFSKFINIMKGVPNVGTFHFDREDIVRHSTLQGIVERYEIYKRSQEAHI